MLDDKIKLSDYIIGFLLENGIKTAFGYIGGAVAHIYDSASKNRDFTLISATSEQGAGFMCDGLSRFDGKTGVCFATSGPGALNLLTPIADCYFDSIPSLFISGQVNTYEYKFNSPLRQIGFQETDIVSIAKPITKYAVMITEPENIRYELEKALFISQNLRKGPVLLDIPMNIQRSQINISKLRSFFDSDEFYSLQIKNRPKIKQISKLLKASKRPCILVGGGVRLANATDELEKFLDKFKIPFVYSLMGKDALSDGELNFGLIGSYGNRYANFIISNSDLIIVCGSRLDTRQTGTDISKFATNAKIIHIDIDKNELGSKIDANIQILADIKEVLCELNRVDLVLDTQKWLEKCKIYKSKFPSIMDIDKNIILPNFIIDKIGQFLENECICADVGQHQMWVAQSLKINKNQRVLFSGGLGAMGFALPCAIGVASMGKKVVVFSGDGGFQMNINELEIIKRRNLKIKIFILNNNSLGMVRQFQEIYFHKNYTGTIQDYSTPNFIKIAKAYGIQSRKITKFKDFDKILSEIFLDDKAEIIEIKLPQNTKVEPKLIVNKPIFDMYPFLKEKDIEKLIIME